MSLYSNLFGGEDEEEEKKPKKEQSRVNIEYLPQHL